MSKKILVIGATGTVGSEVVKGLLASPSKPTVRITTRKNDDQFGNEVEQVVGDILQDQSILNEALKGISRVFLLTISNRHQPAIERAIADKAKAAGVELLVKLSVYGASASEPNNSLIRWHYDAENEIEKSGVDYVILRPNLFLQNFFRDDAKTIKEQGVFYRPGGNEHRISHVDIRDIADTAVVILTDSDINKHRGNTYNITGPESLDHDQLAKKISKVLEKEVKCVLVDDAGLYHSVASKPGMPGFVPHMLVKLFQYYKTNAAAAVATDQKIVTGKEPRSVEVFFTDFKANF